MIVAIGGATATGKSALAVELARRIGGEIISADSMQIYQGMDIGTAKITEAEKGGIPHYLIDIISPKNSYNVAMYVKDANEAIDEIRSKGKTPILVGGTGLYIRSLLYNYSHSAYDEKLRAQITEEYKEKGADDLWNKLRSVDPIAAEKIHKNNVKRVIRALEVVTLTGKSIADTEESNPERRRKHALFCIETDRETLYDRINKRVDLMFGRGLEKEIDRLLSEGVDFSFQSMQAIGYKEFAEYKKGNVTIEQVKESIKINSRHYAKRQETWFHGMDAKWLRMGNIEEMVSKIEQIILK